MRPPAKRSMKDSSRNNTNGIIAGDANHTAYDKLLTLDAKSPRRQRRSSPFAKRLSRQSAAFVDFFTTPRSKNVTFWQRCTLHGIQDLYLATSTGLRVFWALAFIGALVASIYGCSMILIEYMKVPIVVSYFVHDADHADKRGLRVPDLIVCPFSRFDRTFLEAANVSENLSDYIQLAYAGATPYYFLKKFYPGDADAAAYSAELTGVLHELNLSFSEFVDRASLPCQSVIISCSRGDNVTNNCCDETTTVNTWFGRCFRIQGVWQPTDGYGLGVSVVMNLSRNLFTPALNNFHLDGVVISLADDKSGMDYDMKFIPISTHALLSLRATKFEFMNDPPRYVCSERTHLAGPYSRIDCFQECLFEYGQEYCKCTHVAGMHRTYDACTTSQFYDCLSPATREYIKNDTTVVNNCRLRCPPSCQYWQYTPSLSYAKFPSETLKRYIPTTQEWADYQNVIVLDVFYERLEYTLIKHLKRMTSDTFIANLGGQIGLWIGGSILTIVQLFVFAIQWCLRLCSRQHRNGKRPSALQLVTLTPPDAETSEANSSPAKSEHVKTPEKQLATFFTCDKCHHYNRVVYRRSASWDATVERDA